VDLDPIADSHPQKRPRNLSIECPKPKGGSLGEPAFELDCYQIDAHRLRLAPLDRAGQVGRLARNVCVGDRRRRRLRCHQELALHAGEPVAGDAAIVNKIARRFGAERDRRTGPLAGHARRLGALIGKHDIVLGALTIDQRDLYRLHFGRGQHLIGLPVDLAADTDKDHAALGDPGAQRVVDIRHVGNGARRRSRRCWGRCRRWR